MVQKYVSSMLGVPPLPRAEQMFVLPLFWQSEMPVQNFPTPRLLPLSPG